MRACARSPASAVGAHASGLHRRCNATSACCRYTDTKFPGNPTRSFRTVAPMIVVEEIHDWTPLTPEVRETWRRQKATLLENDAEIIN